MTAPWQDDYGLPPPPRRRKRGFWRGFGRFWLYAFATVGFIAVAGTVAGFVVLSRLGGPPDLPSEPYLLTIDLNRGVAERGDTGFGPFGGADDSLAIRPLTAALAKAAEDPQVLAVVLRAGQTGVGVATAEDVRAALAPVIAAGKPLLAFAPAFGVLSPGTIDYFLAAAADELWMAPYGELSLIGLSVQAPFVGEALTDIGVAVAIGTREEYKSAPETFTRAGLSEPARASLQRQADSLLDTIATAIAADRGLDRATVDALIDAPPTGAFAALEAGLIDRVGYVDAFDATISVRFPNAERVAIDIYAANLEPPGDPAATIAYIQALGPVVDRAGDAFDTESIAPDNIGAALAAALEDDGIDAVVLRIDSPGGTYTGADAIWREVARLRDAGKPVVASMGSVAASGGYFIAMAADRIVAERGTITGSIGVYAGKMVIDAATRRLGVTWDGAQAGGNAGMFDWTRPYTPAQWDALNAMLDRIYADFVTKAAEGRGMPYDALEALAGGRVWTGADALDRGLVDALGGPAQALAEARTLLGLPPDAPLEIRVSPRPRSPWEQLTALFEEPAAAIRVEIALPPALAGWPEFLDFIATPGALLRMAPMRVEG